MCLGSVKDMPAQHCDFLLGRLGSNSKGDDFKGVLFYVMLCVYFP